MEEWRESTRIGRWKGRRCKSIGGGAGAMGLGSRQLDQSSAPPNISSAADLLPSVFPSLHLSFWIQSFTPSSDRSRWEVTGVRIPHAHAAATVSRAAALPPFSSRVPAKSPVQRPPSGKTTSYPPRRRFWRPYAWRSWWPWHKDLIFAWKPRWRLGDDLKTMVFATHAHKCTWTH